MLRRSGLLPALIITLLAVGGLAATLVTESAPKLGLDLAGGFSVVLQPEEDVEEDTLDQAIEIIRTRVDGIGVAEPEITRQGQTIVVNLPGVTDRDRARELVGTTAELRFRPLLCDVTVPAAIAAGDLEMPDDVELPEDVELPDDVAPGDDDATTPEDGAETEGDDVEGQAAATPAVRFQEDPDAEPAPEDPDAGDDAPATDDGEPGLDEDAPDLDPSTVDLCTLAMSGLATEDDLAVTDRDGDDAAVPVTLENPDTGERLHLGPALATGEIVETARAQLDPNTGQWSVGLTIRSGASIDAFNAAAATCFGGSPLCPTGQLGIVLDSAVVSAPTIQQPSFQRDQIQISGQFTEGEAKNLALVLRYGALPIALETQATQEVSATLGRDSLDAGLLAGIIGLGLVTLYMVAYYRLLGLVAMGSLAISGALLWAVVAFLGETQGLALTLAGITGIIVSIGVAVDSNVVFYEHLKEDVSRGRTLRSAVSGSFANAFSTIVKADVASLIGAVLLYVLTVGPVRGFAFFLGLSVVLDLVASYFFMRPAAVWLARSKRFQDNPRALGMPQPGAISTAEVAP
jgi:preprotein translocase subunit SecD